MRWSDWLPWLKRRHPLGWPKPKPGVTVWPDKLRQQERKRRKAITDAMIATLGQPQRPQERPGIPPQLYTNPDYVFLVPHQVKPDAPLVIPPGGFLRSIRLEIGPLTGCQCPDDPENEGEAG